MTDRPPTLPEEPRPIWEVHETRDVSRLYQFVLAGFWIVMALLVVAIVVSLR